MNLLFQSQEYIYNYQEHLTNELDARGSDYAFTMDDIYKMTLWKVNRFPTIDDKEFLKKYNQLGSYTSLEESKTLTTEVLGILLGKQTCGVRLAMASTYLRFRNPHIFQIIDQRVWRQVQLFREEKDNTELKVPQPITEQINLYIHYLEDLRKLSEVHQVRFEDADRVFYLIDIEQGNKINY